MHRAGPAEVERAIAGAVEAFETTRHLASWQREEILKKIAAGIAAQRDELAEAIALEAGKPIKIARVEVDRAAFTFTIAAEESKRIYGEIVPLDWLPGNENRVAHVRRVPLGPIAGISPFNFPLNLVAHKVAPALAAGNPILLRPASQTPVSSLMLGRIVLDAGWPEDAIAVLPSSTEVARPLVEDNRIKLLTFTGSPDVGWALKARAGRKRVTLELGGNAAVIVDHDADVAYAAERVAWGGFAYSGQTCISVQRVFVHEDVYEAFTADLLRRVGALKVGDPLDEATDVGPVIDAASADRIDDWIEDAKAGGRRGSRRWYARPEPLAADRPRQRPPQPAGLVRGGVRAARVPHPVRGRRRCDRRCCAERVRAAGRHLHERHARRRRRVRSHRRRWADGQRRVDVPHRPHAVRRSEVVGVRPRGAALRDRGDDRAEAPHVQQPELCLTGGRMVVDAHAHVIVPGLGAEVAWDDRGQVVRYDGREVRAAVRELCDLARILEEQDRAGVDVVVLAPWVNLCGVEVERQNEALAELVGERVAVLGTVDPARPEQLRRADARRAALGRRDPGSARAATISGTSASGTSGPRRRSRARSSSSIRARAGSASPRSRSTTSGTPSGIRSRRR